MKEYVVSPARQGSHGARIFVEDVKENAAVMAVLTKEGIWNGHDKEYTHIKTGNRWLGFEMSSLPEYQERMKRAVVALRFAGYAEVPATKVMSYFR